MNYDHPDSLETDLLVEHLKELKAGRAIDCPVYDYSLHNLSDEVIRIEQKPVILVEGILLLADERIRDLLDIKIYVVEGTNAFADPFHQFGNLLTAEKQQHDQCDQQHFLHTDTANKKWCHHHYLRINPFIISKISFSSSSVSQGIQPTCSRLIMPS